MKEGERNKRGKGGGREDGKRGERSEREGGEVKETEERSEGGRWGVGGGRVERHFACLPDDGHPPHLAACTRLPANLPARLAHLPACLSESSLVAFNFFYSFLFTVVFFSPANLTACFDHLYLLTYIAGFLFTLFLSLFCYCLPSPAGSPACFDHLLAYLSHRLLFFFFTFSHPPFFVCLFSVLFCNCSFLLASLRACFDHLLICLTFVLYCFMQSFLAFLPPA